MSVLHRSILVEGGDDCREVTLTFEFRGVNRVNAGLLVFHFYCILHRRSATIG